VQIPCPACPDSNSGLGLKVYQRLHGYHDLIHHAVELAGTLLIRPSLIIPRFCPRIFYFYSAFQIVCQSMSMSR
jgi:hypothetical protein